jgi:pimeloyl-ACP methyl ester carboxylesterase
MTGVSWRYVLVHNPSLGPSTWVPVAQRLQAGGHDTVVPNLTSVGFGPAPYWERIVDIVADATVQLDDPGPVVLVAHGNAGLYVPSLVGRLPRPVEGVVLVDAGLPVAGDDVPVAAPDFLPQLRAMADGEGRLPRWTDWWPATVVARLVPDPETRAVVVAEQPRLPLDYYAQTVPVPNDWPRLPGAYLQLTEAYDEEASRARSLGWPVEKVAGGHLLGVVDPDRVTETLLRLTGRLGG